MKLTLNDTLNRINHALNYPSVTFDDIYQFFDMAIMELNTTLHISLPSIIEMKESYSKLYASQPNIVVLSVTPGTADTVPEYAGISAAPSGTTYFYDTARQLYAVKINNEWQHFDELYAVCNYTGTPVYYKALKFGVNAPFWSKGSDADPSNVALSEWLPEEWIILYVIPYVCFKYACRDGGTAATFAEEMEQGFQQLQDKYDVRSQVNLNSVAGCIAYTEDVKKYLPDLNRMVPTKAISPKMAHGRTVCATHIDFYDRGGFFND